MSAGPAQLRETEAYFYEQIPLARAMGIRIEQYDGAQLIMTAPLSLNHNHLGTAFGGSLSAVATLAGYGLPWLELADRTCHLVIRESSIAYHYPVREGIRAVCRRPAQRTLEIFKAKFARKGKAGLRLEVEIEENGRTAVLFEGMFVALV